MARIAVIVLTMFLSLFAGAPTIFDSSADFSLRDNPNKVWRYGYSATNSLASDQFRLDKRGDTTGPVGFWHPEATASPGPGYYRYIAFNSAKQSQFGSSNGWAVRPGEVAMEPVTRASTAWFVSWRLRKAPTRSAPNLQEFIFGCLPLMYMCWTTTDPCLTPISMAMEETRLSTRLRDQVRPRRIQDRSKWS
jgi:hypothetical protein